MSIEDAMEYISDLINVYLIYLPITDKLQEYIRTALNLALGALKTIHDMETKGE